MLELAIAAALTAMIVVWGAGKFVHKIEDTAAQATGTWLFEVKRAMDQMLSAHFDALSEGAEPRDKAEKRLFNDPLRPTLSELRTQAYLPSSFPERPPLGGAVSIRLVLGPACPGPRCRIDALAYLGPLVYSTEKTPDLMRIAVAVAAGQGYAGFVTEGSSNRARGANFDFPNPLAPGDPSLPAGTLLIWSGADQTAQQQFVRMRDTRDPDLQGPLSVAQRVTVGEYLKLDGQATLGDPCEDSMGVFARSEQGNMLSCQARTWRTVGGALTIDGPDCPAGAAPVAYYIPLVDAAASSFVWQGHNFASRCTGPGGDAGLNCALVPVRAAKVRCLY